MARRGGGSQAGIAGEAPLRHQCDGGQDLLAVQPPLPAGARLALHRPRHQATALLRARDGGRERAGAEPVSPRGTVPAPIRSLPVCGMVRGHRPHVPAWAAVSNCVGALRGRWLAGGGECAGRRVG